MVKASNLGRPMVVTEVFFGLKLHEIHQFHVFHHVLVQLRQAADGWFKAKRLLQNEQIFLQRSGFWKQHLA